MASTPLSATLIPALLLALAAPAGASSPAWVLSPGQDRAAERLVDLEDPELMPGITLSRISLEVDHVRVLLQGRSGMLEARIYAPGTTIPEGRATPAGVLVVPQLSPDGLEEALVARLNSTDSRLEWRSLVASFDKIKAEGEVAELLQRMRWRLGLEHLDPDPPWQPPAELSTPWNQGISGHHVEARDALKPLLRRDDAPPGSLSLWLATGSPRPGPCSTGGPCPIKTVLHHLEEGRFDPQWSARWAHEPRVLTLVARSAAARGEREVAARMLAQALGSPLPDQAAVALAVSWGWGPGRELSSALPSPPEATGDPAAPPVGLWLTVAFLAWVLAWVLNRPTGWSRAAAILSTLGALGVVVSLMGDGATDPPELVGDPFDVLGRGSSCVLSPTAALEDGWHGQVVCEGGRAGVVLRGRGDSSRLDVIPIDPPHRLSGGVERWVAGLEQVLGSGGGSIPTRGAPAAARLSRPLRARILESGSAAAHVLTGPVAAAAWVGFLLLILRALGGLRASAPPGGALRRLLLWAAALCVITHGLSESRMVMVYSGYAQTTELLGWEALRYGAGANWIYGPWLELLGADHGVIQGLNRLLGLGGIVMMVALSAQLIRGSAWGVALLLALSPILWRDHASESILVGGWAMMISALYGLSEAARTSRMSSLLLALPCGILAGFTRPEIALALVPLSALVLWHIRPTWSGRGWGVLALGLLAALALAWPHGQLVIARVAELVSQDALPGMAGLPARIGGDLGTGRGLYVATTYGPALLVALLPVGLFVRGRRILTGGLLLVALLWMALTRVDLPEVSVPRVHAPPWTLLLLVGALGLDGLWRTLSPRLGHRTILAAGAVFFMCWLGAAAATLPRLHQPTNADTEEALLQETRRVLPGGEICLATPDNRDLPPPGKTHRFFPFYLFGDRDPPPRLTHLAGLQAAEPACPDGTYALLGMRCYMHLREGESAGPAPEGAKSIEACETFRREWNLDPLLEWEAENHGDLAFPMYPTGDTLKVGLYRVMGRR